MFLDAHCHLQDPRFAGNLDVAALRQIGIRKFVVNGTREEDWPQVAELAAAHPEVIPSFGLHPWYVADRSPDWLTNLQEYLDSYPEAAIGEIGLDRRIEGYDTPAQESVFLAQLDLATRENRPVSIHCLKAWGRMLERLQTNPRPERGFLLHSYGGPSEMTGAFVKLGGYFSFSGYFLLPRKAKTREAFRQIPLDRLLIETDAPDQRLPENLDRFELRDAETGQRINHPGNLAAVYDGVAGLREMPAAELRAQVNANFERFFTVH